MYLAKILVQTTLSTHNKMKTIQNYTRHNKINATGKEKQGVLIFQRAEKSLEVFISNMADDS